MTKPELIQKLKLDLEIARRTGDREAFNAIKSELRSLGDKSVHVMARGTLTVTKGGEDG